MVDRDHLETLVVVAEEQSFERAATLLNRSSRATSNTAIGPARSSCWKPGNSTKAMRQVIA